MLHESPTLVRNCLWRFFADEPDVRRITRMFNTLLKLCQANVGSYGLFGSIMCKRLLIKVMNIIKLCFYAQLAPYMN